MMTECPKCHAKPGQPCVDESIPKDQSHFGSFWHRERIFAGEEQNELQVELKAIRDTIENTLERIRMTALAVMAFGAVSCLMALIFKDSRLTTLGLFLSLFGQLLYQVFRRKTTANDDQNKDEKDEE